VDPDVFNCGVPTIIPDACQYLRGEMFGKTLRARLNIRRESVAIGAMTSGDVIGIV